MAFSVVVAYADDLARIALKSIVESHSEYTVELADNYAALARSADRGGDAIWVVDSKLTGMNGIVGLAVLLQPNPRIKVCLAMPSVTREVVASCVSKGILSCVDRVHLADDVTYAIDALADGRMFFSRLAGDPPPRRTANAPVLTQQQLNVLRSLATGRSNKQIARELGICEGTVKAHLNGAYRTLGVRNRVAAASKLREMYESISDSGVHPFGPMDTEGSDVQARLFA